jgi:hypothetical protein
MGYGKQLDICITNDHKHAVRGIAEAIDYYAQMKKQ